MSDTSWILKLYDKNGNFLANLPEATNRRLTLTLNGFDQLELGLYLDDPAALQISKTNTQVIKLWRNVNRPGYEYQSVSSFPLFAGQIGSITSDGDSNLMSLIAYSPLWRLQFRFHLLNHRLVINNLSGSSNPDGQIGGSGVGNPWDQSALMWKIIDLINGQFGVSPGSISNTGIAMGTWPQTVAVSPYFIAKGSNSWGHIDGLLNRSASVDLFPLYIHQDGSPTLMYFSTDEKRGDDRSTTIFFNYHTGINSNLDNLTERIVWVPNKYANYVWAVGHGGPNGGAIASAQNTTLMNQNGVFMRIDNYDQWKVAGLTSPLQGEADFNLSVSKVPSTGYEISMSPVMPPYYFRNFYLGDVVTLNANKGALQVNNIKQRIYEVKLSMSDNNVESPIITVSHDFVSRVAETD